MNTTARCLLMLGPVAVVLAGCASGEDIIADSLSGPHPADAGSAIATAPPPVPPAMLEIAPTLLGPTETGRVDPDPILPKMDSFFRDRRMPPGYEAFNRPATRPADREVELPDPLRYGEPPFEGDEE